MASPAECTDFEASATGLLMQAAALVPTAHYLAAVLLALAVFLYNFLEIHLLHDFLHGFRGDPVVLTYDPASKIYEGVVSKCRILHGRYLVTPWLASPHFQTVFLNFFGRPPTVVYRRQLYSVQDGGTVALDWLYASEVARSSSYTDSTISKDFLGKSTISKDDTTPIVVVVPGLTSDSFSPYLKHTTYSMAKHGWNVVVSNHRGLGGISITSDYFYNAGWTEDLREVVNYLHHEYPKAPLFAVGTSIGANILVKYLGEDGENTPIAGAASICSPWDLVVGDRFITRKLTQRLYDKALAIGLKGTSLRSCYCPLEENGHQPILARLANWEGISESRSVRDFDNHATCHIGKFETVDTYYRRCSSVNFIGNVAIPLLCISALDDPVCTREAIPWDECRANKNIVLATTAHGGHLGFFQGLTARSLWWVGAAGEFLTVLYSSPFMHGQKKTQEHSSFNLLQSDIDKGPYLNITEDGMVAATSNDGADHITKVDSYDDGLYPPNTESEDKGVLPEQRSSGAENEMKDNDCVPVDSSDKEKGDSIAKTVPAVTAPVKRSIMQLVCHYDVSIWLLAYIAIITSWPLLGSVLSVVFRRKIRGFLPASWITRLDGIGFSDKYK